MLKTLTMFTSEPLQIFTQIAVSLDRVKVARKELAIAEASHSPKAVKIAKEQLKVAKDKYRHLCNGYHSQCYLLSNGRNSIPVDQVW